VRFYVQEKLIDPPPGRGRGANFADHHLVQLQQARALQNAGFAPDAIRERRGELGLGLRVMETFIGIRPCSTESENTNQHSEDEELDPETCIRIPLAKGVELMVSKDQPLPSPRQLVQIALYIRKVFGRR
jgi:hypothetical protein